MAHVSRTNTSWSNRFLLHLTRFLDHPWVDRYLPTRLHPWRRQVRRHVINHSVIPALVAAQENNVGIVEAWAAPSTSTDEILRWYDEQIASVPREIPRDLPFNLFKMMVVACSEQEWEAAEAAASDVLLPEDRLIAIWQGNRTAWWAEGRAYLATAIPSDHSGLAVTCNRLGATFWSIAYTPKE